jgi:hypothetical protein
MADPGEWDTERVMRGWRLVGRREELCRIARARHEGAGGVVLVGQPGVGKREIALLAARGGTSRAIADQLYLSERTVENHLQRIYTKFGARGRSELHALLDVGAAQARDRGAGGDAERDA